MTAVQSTERLPNSMISIKCMFCDVPLEPSQKDLPSSRTEEHVFARWIRDNVANNKMKMFTATLGSPPTLHRQPSLDRIVNSSICRACNNGWMECLETAVDPIAKRLFNGQDIRTFETADIGVLARWTAKTTAVLSYVIPQKSGVPRRASLSLHPQSQMAPQVRFFYSHILSRQDAGGRASPTQLWL